MKPASLAASLGRTRSPRGRPIRCPCVPPQQLLGATVEVDDATADRVEHDDRVDDGIEDRLREAAIVPRPGDRRRGRLAGGGSAVLVPDS